VKAFASIAALGIGFFLGHSPDASDEVVHPACQGHGSPAHLQPATSLPSARSIR